MGCFGDGKRQGQNYIYRLSGDGQNYIYVFRGRGKITCNLLGAGEITYDLGGGSNTLFFKAAALKKQAPTYLKK